MAITTKIPWCQSTWNPWHGCRKVSPGCDNCFMHSTKERFGQNPGIVVRSKTTFTAPRRWLWHATGDKPWRVFVCSWSDFFIKDADPWRAEAWEIIRRTPQLTYLILTKRPHRIARCLPPDWDSCGWPNVWLGVTVESMDTMDARLQRLAGIPARVRFVSAEPLLGPLDLTPYLGTLDWVIVGAEKIGRCRPGRRCKRAWVRALRDQCQGAGVAFFFKQGAVDGRIVEVPPLDGRRWGEFPTLHGQATRGRGKGM